MWTSTLDLNLKRVLLTRLLSPVYPNIYYSSLSPLHIANIPRPTLPAANWVRVRNHLAGICGSDLHLIHTNVDRRTSIAALLNHKRIYPGREVVGEVIEIGEGVQHLRVGDRVVLQYSPNCLSNGAKPVCRACTAGSYNLCEYGPLPGPEPIGGGWSEEMLLHEQQLFRLPSGLTDEQGVILEPAAVALHAVLRHLPQANDNVLIIGAGTSGLLTLQILHALVPKAQISILARYPFQIEQATRLGADHVIYPLDPYASVQRATHAQLAKGRLSNRTILGGYDVIYETLGQQKTLHHALRWLRTHGTMVLTGSSLHMMKIDLTPIWHQEINLLGSLSHGRETWPLGKPTSAPGTATGPSTFSVVTELIQQKLINPEELITHRFSLNSYKNALLAAKHKKRNQSIKVLFDHALLPASAVPNTRVSARPSHPVLPVPQGKVSMKETLKTPDAIVLRQAPEQEAMLQSNRAQPTSLPKIPTTPPPQISTEEAWNIIQHRQDIAQSDAEEDTDPALPTVKRRLYKPGASSRIPATPLPIQPTLTPTIETPATKTDADEASSIPAQPTLEAQDAESASMLPISHDHTLSEVPVELPTNEVVPVELSTNEEVPTELPTELPTNEEVPVELPTELPTNEVVPVELSTNEEVPTELPTNEEVPVESPTNEVVPFSLSPETMDINALTEDRLPTQTVLDHLFDSDTSSLPAFLAELSNLGELNIPELSVKIAETPIFSDTPNTILPIETVQASLFHDTPDTSLPIEAAETPLLPDTPDTSLPAEDVEAPLSPDTPDTSLPLEAVEAPFSTDTPDTSLPLEAVEAPFSPDTPDTSLPLEASEAPFSPDTPDTSLPLEAAETPLSPDTSDTSLPLEAAETPLSPDTPDTSLPTEAAETPLSPDTSDDTSLPIEAAEASLLPDTSDTPLPIEAVEALPSPDTSDTQQSSEDAEAPLLPDTSVTTLPIDSADQATGDQTNDVPTISQPKQKRRGNHQKLQKKR